ncbi:MAG: cache domain-containing protein, partial [Sulfuritalea sp.]|nr:cache domain-containing protein [Sulfuritalea sp.]
MNPVNLRAKQLHVRLFTLMLGLIIAFFLALALVTWYMGTERDMRDTNDKITRVGRELKGVLDSELDPMKTAIRMLAETSLVSGRTHRERLAQFGAMAAALEQNPTAGAVYAGTGNGSFVMMRNLKDRPKDRATFSAPDEAMFLVQSVNRDTGAAVGQFDFYDAKLAPVKSVSKPDYQFDPRVRPWYEQAERESPPDGIVQTAPYIFASNQKVGITLATLASDRSGAVGIDMSLTGLSRLIGSQKVSPSAELVLFDGAGRVLAYRDSDRIFKKDADGKTVVVAVPELKVAALAALFEQWKAGAGEAADVALKLDVGGKEWYSRIQRIDGTGGTPLFLGIAAPTAELMADSIRIRNTTAALSLALLLVMLPVVVYTSKRISRPLIDLVKVAKAIESFDFSGADPAPSHIREVDDLALNMTKMKQTLKRFLDISSALSAESNFHRLINIILREMILVSGSTSGSLALVSPDKAGIRTVARQINGVEQDVENAASVPLADAGSAPVEVKAVLDGSRQSLHVDHNDAGHRALYGSLLAALEVPRAYVVALPLRNRSNE